MSDEPTVGEQADYFRRLTKSTNHTTREYADDQLLRLEVQAGDVAVKGRPHPGQRYTHGWVPIGVHPDEPAEVHGHLDAARRAMHDMATADARQHVDRALAAAQHGRTRRAIRRYAREHISPPVPGSGGMDRDLLHAIR